VTGRFPPPPAAVARAYDAREPAMRAALMDLRDLVLETAARTEGAGEIEETLKWGEPSFVTVRPRSGSTIRIDAVKNRPDRYAMFFICTTNLVDRFRERYPDCFEFAGNRALVLRLGAPLPRAELAHCIAMALTYHRKA